MIADETVENMEKVMEDAQGAAEKMTQIAGMLNQALLSFLLLPHCFPYSVTSPQLNIEGH